MSRRGRAPPTTSETKARERKAESEKTPQTLEKPGLETGL